MRKTLLIIAAVAMQLAAGAQTLLEADFNKETDFNKWTVIDANNDGSTWAYYSDESDATRRCQYRYNNDNAGDDWLISPAITPTADCNIVVTVTAKGSDYFTESMDCWYGDAPSVAGMTAKGAEISPVKGSDQTALFVVKGKAGVPLYLGIHATSPAGQWKIYLQSAKAEASDHITDLAVDAITSPVTGEGLAQESVTISITNKGTEAMTGFNAAYSIDGGDPVVEKVSATIAPGATTSYTFAAKADLSKPRHTYNIKAWTEADGDINTANDAATAAVKHVAPATVPYSMGFEQDEETSDVAFYDTNADGTTWKILTNSFMTSFTDRGQRCLGIGYNSSDKTMSANDWAILGPIQVEQGYHVLKFWYAADKTHPEKLEACWGNGGTPADMTNKIVEYAPFISPSGYEQSVNMVYFDKPQQVYIGFHGFSDPDENWLTIDDVTLDKVASDAKDAAVEDITTPTEYMHRNSSRNISFVIANKGVSAVSGNLTVKLDGQAMTTQAFDLEAQADETVSFTNVLDGLEAGSHTLEVSIAADGDTNADNDKLTRVFNIMPEPKKWWDFEDGRLPSDFTFRAEDSGTINPSAGDFTDNMSWELLETSDNDQIGSYILSGTSYIDGVSKADRWVVLPKTHIPNDAYFLVWDARTFSDKYVESYEVKVSDSEDNAWYYDKVYSVPMEDDSRVQTHGVRLDKYSGKDVYIAFRLTSRPGDRLLLDNIGLYDCYGTTTAVTRPTATAQGAISVSGDVVSAAGASVISVADISGRTVLTAHAGSADLSSLPKGIYIISAKGDGINATKKIARK